MPKIPTYVSGEQISLPDQPRISGSVLAAPYESLQQGAHGIESGATLALGHTLYIEAAQRHQAQLSESVKHLNGAKTDLADAELDLRTGKRDPATGELIEPPANAADFLPRWRDKYKEIGQNYLDKITDPRVKDMFTRGWEPASASAYREAVRYQRGLFVKEDNDKLFQSYHEALRLSANASTPEDAKREADVFRNLVAGKGMLLGGRVGINKMLDSFEKDLASTEATKEIDVTDTYERKNYVNRLDPAKLDALDHYAARVTARREADSKKRDADVVAAREDRNLEISTLIDKRQFADAKQKLEFYADNRLMSPSDVERLRKEIYNPPVERASDPAIAGRILLDVESITPTTTEAQIDDSFAKHQQGLPGLSLGDAVKAKNQLRSTQVAINDKARTEIVRQHNQAEQELRSMLGLKEGIIASALQDSPERRLYGVLLPELRRRSAAFKGTEAPLEAVESMRERINIALGTPTVLKPNELKGLYPDWSSLERARRQNIISEDVYQEEIRRRQGLPPVAPTGTGAKAPAAPAAPKRKSSSFPQ